MPLMSYFFFLVLPFRRSGAIRFGLRVKDLVDLQEGVSPAGGLHLDYRLRLGVHAAQRTDAAGAGSPRPSDAQRFVLLFMCLSSCCFKPVLSCRLDVARCSTPHRCGSGSSEASVSSPCRRSPHPVVGSSWRTQQARQVLVKWSKKETRTSTGQTAGAQTPKARVLVWGSAIGTIWDSSVGGNWQKCRKEGWRLVRPGYSGTYTTVTTTMSGGTLCCSSVESSHNFG